MRGSYQAAYPCAADQAWRAALVFFFKQAGFFQTQKGAWGSSAGVNASESSRGLRQNAEQAMLYRSHELSSPSTLAPRSGLGDEAFNPTH